MNTENSYKIKRGIAYYVSITILSILFISWFQGSFNAYTWILNARMMFILTEIMAIGAYLISID